MRVLNTVPPHRIGVIAAVSRREVRWSLLGLFLAQAAATSATTISISLGSVVATRIAGTAAVSGVPATVNMVAAAGSAFVAGLGMARYGRRTGIITGYLVGAVGAALGCVFALAGNLPGFLLGSAMVGMAQAVILQGRYAAAELVPARTRGRVIGLIQFGAVFGALLTVLLSPGLQQAAARLDVPAIELGWGQAAVLLAVGAAVIALLFRDVAGATAGGKSRLRLADFLATAGEPRVRLGVASMVVGQAVMVMLMNLVPLHAEHQGLGLGTISAIITAHVVGMYGFAWLSGTLVDRLGAATIGAAGAALQVSGALVSVSETSAVGLGLAMFLIGLGWNFCFVGGSAQLARSLHPSIRVRFEGTADVLVWLCAGSATLGGGFLVGIYSYSVVGLAGGLLATGLLLLTGATWVRTRGVAPAGGAG